MCRGEDEREREGREDPICKNGDFSFSTTGQIFFFLAFFLSFLLFFLFLTFF